MRLLTLMYRFLPATVTLCSLAAGLLAGPARADFWTAWAPVNDGQRNQIFLCSNVPEERLGSDSWRVKNGYPVPVRVEIHIVDHRGDAPAASDAFTQVVRRTLRPGQVWNVRTVPTASVALHALELLPAPPAAVASGR